MSKKTIIALILFIAVPVMIYFFYPTDESRIKKLIKTGATAIEQEDLKKVTSCVSLSYRDDYGMTYLYLKEGFKRLFNVYENFEIDYESLEITVKDKKATAELGVWVIVSHGADRGYLVGNAAEPLTIKFSLEKERLKWQVVKTEGLPKIYF